LLVTIANLGLLENNKLPKLRNVFFAGEVMPAKHMKYWLKYHPDAHYSNLYGPTEITVDCTYFDVPNDWNGDTLPIGKPCKNTGIIVLDENDKAADEGELCVKGSSLALGYWKNKEKTDEVFCQNPLNSDYIEMIYRTGDLVRIENELIYFIGRKDFQIKHNGYRIELGEIESIVSSLESVDSCVAGYISNEKLLYLVVVINDDISELTFRKSLLPLLPKYMMPAKIKFVKEMPLTPNGKFNRKELDNMMISELR
jgi:acyl-coenzyme A synthetase/AMP-(fatty) acid ligase